MRTAWSLADLPPLDGRVYVITGANSGLGRACAGVLVAGGARVVMACRDVARAAAAAEALHSTCGGVTAVVEPLDLADLASVRGCATRVLERYPRIDGLLLNAGLMAAARARTADGLDLTFGVNHVGHFALAAHLRPALRTARVVSVSSLYHHVARYRPGDDPAHPSHASRGGSYADSKLANLLFAFELDRRARAANLTLDSTAAHPGFSATDFQRRSARVGGSRLRASLSAIEVALFAQSAERGALPLLRALTDPTVRGGAYLGPAGPFEVRGSSVAEARTSAAARDTERAHALWELSERLAGLPFQLG